jgi:hypothetical protein
MARITPSISSTARPSPCRSISLATTSVSGQSDDTCSTTSTGPAMVSGTVNGAPT